MRSWAAVRSSSVTRLSASEMTGPVAEAESSWAAWPSSWARLVAVGGLAVVVPGVVRRGHGRRRQGEDGDAAHERRAAQRGAGSPGEERRAQEQRQRADGGGRAEAGGEEVLGADGLRLLEDGRPREPPGALERPGEDRSRR